MSVIDKTTVNAAMKMKKMMEMKLLNDVDENSTLCKIGSEFVVETSAVSEQYWKSTKLYAMTVNGLQFFGSSHVITFVNETFLSDTICILLLYNLATPETVISWSFTALLKNGLMLKIANDERGSKFLKRPLLDTLLDGMATDCVRVV
jgi:hypothetical protein